MEHLADRAREGDDVADVAHGGRVEHEPLEADAEARVRLRAEAARVEVGGVVLLLKPTRDYPRWPETTRDCTRLPETTRDWGEEVAIAAHPISFIRARRTSSRSSRCEPVHSGGV